MLDDCIVVYGFLSLTLNNTGKRRTRFVFDLYSYIATYYIKLNAFITTQHNALVKRNFMNRM